MLFVYKIYFRKGKKMQGGERNERKAKGRDGRERMKNKEARKGKPTEG